MILFQRRQSKQQQTVVKRLRGTCNYWKPNSNQTDDQLRELVTN
jgi:hypothetical protein